jgi:hypothetical protein
MSTQELSQVSARYPESRSLAAQRQRWGPATSYSEGWVAWNTME